MNALILVDIQNDFLPGGSLAVPDGDQVIDLANDAILRAKDRGDLVIATQDYHPKGHGSFASQHEGSEIGETIKLDDLDQILWPDHCIEGTHGAEFSDELRTDLIDRVFPKGSDPSVDSYSGFFDNDRRRATGLAQYLREHGVVSVGVLGLATDYCVKFTALDAISEGFETSLLIDSCRGVDINPGDVEKAVQEMRDAGIRVVSNEGVKI